jgi:hypothetical protein
VPEPVHLEVHGNVGVERVEPHGECKRSRRHGPSVIVA